MAAHQELNTFDEGSCNDISNEGRFTRGRVDGKIFFPRYTRSVSFLCRPRPRKPLASYMRRLSVQYESYNGQMFAKNHDSSKIYIQPKYESFVRQRTFEEEFSRKSFSTASRKNLWLSQIQQVKKGFSYLLSTSSLFKATAGVIIGILIGISFYV